jgi:ribosomal protein L37E
MTPRRRGDIYTAGPCDRCGSTTRLVVGPGDTAGRVRAVCVRCGMRGYEVEGVFRG